MLALFTVVSSVILLAFVAFVVLTRLIYKLRKCSGLSVLLLAFALAELLVLQISMIDSAIYAEVFATQNFIIAVAMVLLGIYLWVMTVINRRVYKWDGISYGPSVCVIVMLLPFYFVGVVVPAMAAGLGF